MSSIGNIQSELLEASNLLNTFLNDQSKLEAIEQAASLMIDCIKADGKILTCGNGGSGCDAMHFAEELTGRYRENREPIAALSISDPSHITCVGNDYGFEHIFERYVRSVGKPGDVLLAISTSGKSANVIKACEAAKARGIKVVGLTGKDGGLMANLCDVEIRVPHYGYADRIQEIHIKVIHILMMLIEKGVC
jgi:D-sedoheptulose 7-phosphate isomerase